MIRVQLTIRTKSGGAHVFNHSFETHIEYTRYKCVMKSTCGKDDELVFKAHSLCAYDRKRNNQKLGI